MGTTGKLGSGLERADRLDSWKEIAAYLRRDVRTVQRWERSEGLPVHRHKHGKLGSIFAFRAELAEWSRTRQLSAPSTNGLNEKIKLAVLPFTNLGDHRDDYFSEGLTEEMMTQVVRLAPGKLTLLASSATAGKNTTSTALNELREDFGVEFVLEGKVRRSGKRVRTTAQLIELKGKTQLWGQTYDRGLDDVLGIQADIAQSIAREINLVLDHSEKKRLSALLQGRQAVPPGAYDSYLLARYHSSCSPWDAGKPQTPRSKKR